MYYVCIWYHKHTKLLRISDKKYNLAILTWNYDENAEIKLSSMHKLSNQTIEYIRGASSD